MTYLIKNDNKTIEFIVLKCYDICDGSLGYPSKKYQEVFNMSAKKIARAAVIAALYAVLAIAVQPLSYGPLQFRFSECLVLLPCIMPEAVLGVTIGCLIANCFSPFGVYDIVFGTLITLVAAVFSRLLSKRMYFAVLPPITLNAAILPLMWLLMGTESVYWANVLSIFISQTVLICAIALPLHYVLKRNPKLYK